MDIYRNYFNKSASESNLVITGRVVGVVALILAMITAPQLKSLDQVFQLIQDLSGYISPAIVAIFMMGIFWKRTTTNAALMVAIVAIPLSWAMGLIDGLPFLDRMGIVFGLLIFVMIGVSMADKSRDFSKSVHIDKPWLRYGMIAIILATIGVPCYHGLELLGMSNIVRGLITMGVMGIMTFALLKFQTEDEATGNSEGEAMDNKWFELSGTFVAGSILICGILAVLYWVFW